MESFSPDGTFQALDTYVKERIKVVEDILYSITRHPAVRRLTNKEQGQERGSRGNNGASAFNFDKNSHTSVHGGVGSDSKRVGDKIPNISMKSSPPSSSHLYLALVKFQDAHTRKTKPTMVKSAQQLQKQRQQQQQQQQQSVMTTSPADPFRHNVSHPYPYNPLSNMSPSLMSMNSTTLTTAATTTPFTTKEKGDILVGYALALYHEKSGNLTIFDVILRVPNSRQGDTELQVMKAVVGRVLEDLGVDASKMKAKVGPKRKGKGRGKKDVSIDKEEEEGDEKGRGDSQAEDGGGECDDDDDGYDGFGKVGRGAKRKRSGGNGHMRKIEVGADQTNQQGLVPLRGANDHHHHHHHHHNDPAFSSSIHASYLQHSSSRSISTPSLPIPSPNVNLNPYTTPATSTASSLLSLTQAPSARASATTLASSFSETSRPKLGEIQMVMEKGLPRWRTQFLKLGLTEREVRLTDDDDHDHHHHHHPHHDSLAMTTSGKPPLYPKSSISSLYSASSDPVAGIAPSDDKDKNLEEDIKILLRERREGLLMSMKIEDWIQRLNSRKEDRRRKSKKIAK
jgi:hypothetical protein